MHTLIKVSFVVSAAVASAIVTSSVFFDVSHASPPPSEEDLEKRIRRIDEVDREEKDATRRLQREPVIPGAALADRDALSPTIPVNRDLAVAFTRRPDTKDDAEMRLRIVNAIWRTPLGQTLVAYVFDEIDPLELPSRSRQFMRLIFADGSQTTTRMAALQLLSEDLYARGRLTEDAHRRLFLLQSDVQQEAMNLQSQTKNLVVYVAFICFILSLPFGSPMFREEAAKVWQRPMAFFRRILRRANGEQKLDRITLGRLFHRGVGKGFEVTRWVNAFFATFGPASTVFFFYREWGDGATGQIVHDKIMLLGLDALVRATEF